MFCFKMTEVVFIQKFDALPNYGTHQGAVQSLFPSTGKKDISCSPDSPVTSLPITRSYDIESAGYNFRRPPVSVKWKNITLTTKGGIRILKGVSGAVNTGELTAVMGPSGAGKTSLLNVLSSFTQQKVSGNILVNGFERDTSTYRKLSCYIMQEDHALPHLTVRETIHLAACFKIPTTVSSKEKRQAVDECMRSLGLTDRQNNKACELSGGEKKRLCIAQELVINPPLIFLDEPTSGLDSSSCFHFIELLKSLADQGHTVVCTIHQPSSRIFEIFDKLYMLAEGRCIYRGFTKDLIPFLAEQGLSCPQYHNPTDFITEVATGEHGDWNWKLKTAIDARADLEDSLIPADESVIFDRTQNMASTIRLSQDKAKTKPSIFKPNYPDSNYSGYATSSWYQLKVLTYRSLICNLREPMSTLYRLYAQVSVGLLIGLLFFGIGNDASKVFNNAAMLFVSLVFLAFTATMPTALTFSVEKTILAREHLNSWYSAKMYYIAKTMAEIPFQIILPVIYSSIVYWMTSQPNDLIRFSLLLMISITISLVAQSVGFLIGAATNVQKAIFLAPVSFILPILFSGFFIAFNAIPLHLQWLSYLMYLRYGFQSVLLAIYSMDRPELSCDQISCHFQKPVDFLKEMGMSEDSFYVDYAAIWGIFFVVKIAAYYVLYYTVINNR